MNARDVVRAMHAPGQQPRTRARSTQRRATARVACLIGVLLLVLIASAGFLQAAPDRAELRLQVIQAVQDAYERGLQEGKDARGCSNGTWRAWL